MVNAFQNNQFSNAAVTGFQSGQANFGLSNEATYQAQTAGIPAAFGGGAQAVFQPGFAGTDVQQVRNQIARDGGYGYTGAQQSFAQTAGNAGVPASFGGGAQAIFQPGFAGTDAQQVRNEIARDIGFGVQPNFANAGFGQSVGTAGIPAAFGGGAQAIFQPGFAGTDAQQVRNQISRDGGFGYGNF
ncbi:hypothetical protein KDJ56_11750 [Brevibacillus composti]|uniref:Uncharacterized protein n=1 Tax=Brevibacillus composti TaxID=2796470 RepID=A0A7T5EHD0_9BACL|nr:hypothetical protein [Brevibacillus composti]QQE72652.1 hypothetical protein JD108_11805 [Brevibacillus composti]QUO39730.1 hypothetical protein KDJ56_11750 [Brevibacillus composti]